MNSIISRNIFKPTHLQSLFILFIFCFLIFFFNNSVIPADLMEARNLATAQEMVRTDNYLIPTMNGELRLEKPPLPTWIAASVENILPDNLAVQRGMAACAATLMAMFLYLLMFRLTREKLLALVSAVVLVTSYNVVMMGRTATWDIYCHSFMLGGIYFLVVAFESDGSQIVKFSLTGIFMGLSFLSKGPIAIYALLLPFAIAYAITYKPKINNKGFSIFLMFLIFLVISFWWPLYIAVVHPETGLAVAGKESANWLNHNTRPFWYYWGFSAEAGIWAFFWVSSLILFFWNKRTDNNRIFRFSVLWTLSALILLSLIPEKKTRYLLPLVIPGAINIAFYFWYSLEERISRRKQILFKVNGFIIVAVALSLPIILYFLFVANGLLSWSVFIPATTLFVAIMVWIVLGMLKKYEFFPIHLFSCTALLMTVFMIFCFHPVGKLFINPQRHSIHALRGNSSIKNLPLYHNSKEPIRMELVYEANKNIRPLNFDNDSIFYAALPFILVSSEPTAQFLAGKNVKIEYIDTFDNNWKKPDSKRYNKHLVKEVSIIRKQN